MERPVFQINLSYLQSAIRSLHDQSHGRGCGLGATFQHMNFGWTDRRSLVLLDIEHTVSLVICSKLRTWLDGFCHYTNSSCASDLKLTCLRVPVGAPRVGSIRF